MAEQNRDELQDMEIKDNEQSASSNAHATTNEEICFPNEEVERLLAALEEKNRLLDEMSDRHKRLQADFDNFRRRTRQEKEELSAIITENVICQFLPVVDNLERALSSAATQDAAAILAGVDMIYRQLLMCLEKQGVTPIQAAGCLFDPQQHDAVMRVEDSDQPDGTIVAELQKGYAVNGKVIRPSMVKVVNHG